MYLEVDPALRAHKIAWAGIRTKVSAQLLVALNNWCDTQPLCKGNLGIPRRQMPQIRAHLHKEFFDWLAERGVAVKRTRRKVRDLRATQREIDPEMVDRVVSNGVEKLLSQAPVLASEDGYILDGHHRWAALLVSRPDAEMDLLEVQAPIREVLAHAWAFPGVEYSNRFATLRERVARLAHAKPELRDALVTLLATTAGAE